MIAVRDGLLMLLFFVALGGAAVMVVRLGLRPWWRRRLVRRALWALLALDFVLPAVWFLLKRVGQPAAADSLVTLQLALCFGQVALIGALLVAALLRAGGRLRLPGDGARPKAPARRRFLLDSVAVGLPLVAAGAGVGGVVEAQSPVRLRRIRLELPRLPEALAGLRILHFADVHLWDLVTIDDLERALARAPSREYDLVCVTGDLADDMSQLPRALELIADLQAPLGHYATLGNHEHAMGLEEALGAYASGPVELMRRSGKVLSYRGQPFVLAGIDDLRAEPRRGHRVFYPDQLDGALGPTEPDAFTVLMSHRPSVMPFAAARDVDLVLAGHTHGGQLAVGGTSLLELNGATNWAWGVYRHERTVMYVTCGLGHWFPFRLGCPPEMVLLELQPAPVRSGGLNVET